MLAGPVAAHAGATGVDASHASFGLLASWRHVSTARRICGPQSRSGRSAVLDAGMGTLAAREPFGFGQPQHRATAGAECMEG